MRREVRGYAVDLVEELKKLLSALDSGGVEYALCGGLALAVHGFARATVDIDVLIEDASLEQALKAVAGLGYVFAAAPMTLAGGAVRIRRVSRLERDSGGALTLDFLLVTSELETVWTDRIQVPWEGGTLHVVSVEGLIAMKRMRGSLQDRHDIEMLTGGADEEA